MRHHNDSDSDAESFHSAHDDHDDDQFVDAETSTSTYTTSRTPQQAPEPITPSHSSTPPTSKTSTNTAELHQSIEHFPPAEEAALLATSNTEKATGNAFFTSSSFSSAIGSYDRALASCPIYLDYEIAVLHANIAACHLKLSEWKEAVEQATKSLDCLERLDPLPKAKKVEQDDKGSDDVRKAKEAKFESTQNGSARTRPPPARPAARPTPAPQAPEPDIIEEVDDATAAAITALAASGHTFDEVQKLRVKALLRRAKANSEIGSWAALQTAEEDYRLLLSPRLVSSLSPMDARTVKAAVSTLPRRLEEAKKRDVDEMMGKLKELGNGLLKPFGLSTDAFKFVKDEKTGGYSVNFGGK